MGGQEHHSHDHAHTPADFGRAFAVGIALNLAFVAIEAGFGLATGSMALLADAGHNLSDVLGLIIAWAGATLSRRAPSKRFTYGLRGSSILAALFNSLLLLVAVGMIALEAIQRFAEPATVPGRTVMVVAAIGIVVNGATALLFARGRKTDINIGGAWLHMAADTAVSAGVVVAGLLIVLTGASWIDSAASLAICVAILFGTWGLLRESVRMTLAAVPAHIEIDEVRAELEAIAGVTRVHDLHIWNMSTTEIALTAHLVMPGGHPGDAVLAALQQRLSARFHIDHATVQIERKGCADGAGCP